MLCMNSASTLSTLPRKEVTLGLGPVTVGAEPIELAGVAQDAWSQLSENYLHKMAMG